MEQVAVLVPGIMGSELYLGDELIWPGSIWSLKFAYNKMAELMREDLVAKDVIRSFSISDQYGALVEDLNLCGFREDDDPPTLFVFPYDWRKDNALAARALADLVDRIHQQYNRQVEISLIGHSMGGLVSRYYLESAEFAGRPGQASVRRLITLGTPHRGAPLALTAAMGQEKRLFLSADQVLQIASDTRYPSLYQLLPPQGEPFAWNREEAAAYDHIDVYEDSVAQQLGLVKQNLDAARAFHSKLDLSKRPQGVRYFFFVGTRQTTLANVTLQKSQGRYRLQRIEPEDAGDGTVPVWSGLITGVQGRPVGGEHGTIYKNDDLRKTLAVLLGRAGVLAAEDQRVEVALRERVVNPDDPVHVALTFPSAMNELDGEIRVERALFDAAGNPTGFAPASSTHVIRYSGLAAEKLGLTLTAPDITGVYRVAYYMTGQVEPAGSDELFVQEPEA